MPRKVEVQMDTFCCILASPTSINRFTKTTCWYSSFHQFLYSCDFFSHLYAVSLIFLFTSYFRGNIFFLFPHKSPSFLASLFTPVKENEKYPPPLLMRLRVFPFLYQSICTLRIYHLSLIRIPSR